MTHQSAESGSLFLGSAGDAVIGVHTDCIPCRIIFNQLVKVFFLRFIGVLLVAHVRRNADVSCHIKGSGFLFGSPEGRRRNELVILRFFRCEELRKLTLHTALQPFCNVRLCHDLFGIQSFLDKSCDTGVHDVF